MQHLDFKESLTVEFKSDTPKLRNPTILETLVAFANTEGGTLYIGVEDDGKITGIHPDHKDYETLPSYIANNTRPSLQCSVQLSTTSPPYLEIKTDPAQDYIVATTSGKTLQRRLKSNGEPETIPLYPYEHPSRLSDLGKLDYSAQPVPGATPDDFDPNQRQRLRRIIANYSNEKGLLDASDDELDRILGLTTRQSGLTVPFTAPFTVPQPIPTYAGLLLIGKSSSIERFIPTAKTAITIMHGTDVQLNESSTQSILETLDQYELYFKSWNREEELSEGLFRLPIPDIHPQAFREAFINALTHRDYTKLGRVYLQFDNEGLTIFSPGGFIPGINKLNVLDATPRSRNPLLADILKRIGLAERTGRGVDKIIASTLRLGRSQPSYHKSTQEEVVLFIPSGLPDKKFIQVLSTLRQEKGINLSVHQLVILNLLKNTPHSSSAELAEETHFDQERIHTALTALIDIGLVEPIGDGRGRKYILTSAVYSATDNISAYIRHKGIEPIRHDALVLTLAKEKGKITRADVIDLLHISGPQAYRLLKELVERGEIVPVGSGRGAHYTLPFDQEQ